MMRKSGQFDFFIDTKANGTAPEADSIEDDDDDAEAAAEEDHVPPSITDLPPAWVDDDDVVVDIVTTKRLRKLRKDYDETTLSSKEYEERLRRQFLKMHPTPRWAKRATEETSTSTDDLLKLLRTSAPILDQKRKKRTLNPDRLDIMRVKDANQMAYSSSVVQTVRFHPTAPVLMTGGYDRTLRLFQVDGKRNPKIQSLYIKDLPIHRAHFTPDGTEILITGKRNYYYTFDIEKGVVERYSKLAGHDDVNFAESYISSDSNMFAFTGRDGLIHLVSRRTKQWITDLKMNGTVRRLDFSKDGKFLYSFGGDGEVYTWDLGERKCVHKFFDEGCVKATALAVTGGYNGLIATGSDTGVVNIYQTSSAMASSAPKPQKTILNLTTSISSLRFSPDSQILALASMDKKDAMRLLHVPSGKVFQNWPTQQTPLGYVSSIDFSRGGGYLATGNDKGKVLLYRLNAYGAL
ncbi:WD40-repeat-containing domain protein [Gaertneriomyces semiglobifer]|nr:WD40-repeat-containing domain protein [Gaertneriomyces semiglobifer]